jgi:5-methylcytosine-specific restriction endonuclease McrA
MKVWTNDRSGNVIEDGTERRPGMHRSDNGVEVKVGPPPRRSRPAESPQIWKQVDEEFRCLHGEMVLTVLIAKNGTKVYKKQCPICGELGPAIPHSQISYGRREAAIPRDDSIGKRRRDAWRARHDELRAEFQATRDEQEGEDDRAWWEWYSAYLETPKWRRIRAAILRHHNGICQGCLVAPATQVHHKTYEHVGDELLFELEPVCDDCHRKLHPGHDDDDE